MSIVPPAPALRRPAESLVLYVEDHPVNVLLMQAVFDRLPKTRLAVARSGGEAMGLMRGQRPVLLLLDISLPDCRGTELLRRLRHLQGCRNATAVAVTAEYRFDIDGTGFDEVWEKPLDLPRVLGRLKQLLAEPWPLPPVPPAGLASRRRWLGKAFA